MNIETLEQGQECLLQEMNETEKIWGQLQSNGFKNGFKSQGEYNAWRVRAGDAYNYRKASVKELIAYIEKKFGVRYSSAQELRAIITERSLSAPEWLSNNGHEEPSAKAEPEEETVPSVPEIVLSVQSEHQLEGILKRLIEARKAADMTQDDVASYFGFHNTAIGQWERGRTPITLLNLFKLANIYECDPLWLLTGEREVTKEQLGAIAENLEISLGKLWDLMGKQE